jgi:uncharacterized protein (TIGR00251 family)
VIGEGKGGASILVRVRPHAPSSRILGVEGGREHSVLKVAVQAPPRDGEANDELIGFLARALDVPAGTISLAAGAHSRYKRVRFAGLTAAELRRRLAAALEPTGGGRPQG